jgi:hypothetical protein
MWVTGAINALMEGTKDGVVSATKDAMQTSKKGDSPNQIAEPPKTSLQPMAEIVSATSGSGSYLQMAATTTEGIKAVLASHKETLSETQGHLHDHKHEAPEDMLGEVDMMLKAMCDSLRSTKEQQDKPNGIQWVSDSLVRVNSPTVDMSGQNVSIAGNHGQLAFEAQSNVSKCQFDWHQIQMQDVKYVHHNYQVRNAVVGTDSKSGVSNRTYFNEVSTDAAHSISSTTKLHSIQASDIEEKGDNITSRAIGRQDVQAGEGYTLSVGQGTAKGAAPHFFMAGGVGATVAQKALRIGISKLGGGGLGSLGNIVGNPTPGVVVNHTPQGSNYVTPSMTEVIGSQTTNITGMARKVVHGEAINVANKLLADVSKGVKLEGVAGGVLTMLTKKFSLSMTGWMGELINKVIGEVTDCIQFPDLPKLPEIALPRIPQISCMPEAEEEVAPMNRPPASKSEAGGHKEGVHSEKYPIWLEDALKGVAGLSGKVALNQEGVSGTDGSTTHAPTEQLSATFGAPLMVYKGRAPVLGMKKSNTSTNTSPTLTKAAKPGTSSVSTEMKLDGVSTEAQDILDSYAAGTLTKADALTRASSMGVNIASYMDRSDLPATLADTLGVSGTATSNGTPSLTNVISILTGGKSMAVGDVIEAVVGQVPGIKGESVSLEQALNDLGLGSAVGKDGTLESAELLGMVMQRAGLHLPEGMVKMDGDTVSIDVDSALDAALDKAKSFLGDLDPIMKVDKLLKLVGLGTPLTNLLNDLAACAKSWVNIRAILKLPDIALNSVSGKVGKIQVPGLDLGFLKDWSLCGGGKKKAGPILWDGVQQGQAGYEGDSPGTA